MAKKIGVLDLHQSVQSAPQTYVRKNAAHLLVRRLLAVWVIENVLIQRVAIRHDAHIACGRGEFTPKHYIPKELPPMEVGNHRFQEPQSPSWQNDHAIPSRYLKTRARLMRLALGFDKPRKAECLQN